MICTKIMIILLPMLLAAWLPGRAQTAVEADVCFYGGTSAVVIGAFTAQKLGKKAILVEPGHHLGGMRTGGLGSIDIGNRYATAAARAADTSTAEVKNIDVAEKHMLWSIPNSELLYNKVFDPVADQNPGS